MKIKPSWRFFLLVMLTGLGLAACQPQATTTGTTATAIPTQPPAALTGGPTPTLAAPQSTATATTEPAPSLLPTIMAPGSPVPLLTAVLPPPGVGATMPPDLTGPGPAAPVAAAVKDLALRLGVPEKDITVVRVENVDWPDPSLGLPEPGRSYAQVITPGQRILLSHAGKTYEYRAGSGSLKYAGLVTPAP